MDILASYNSATQKLQILSETYKGERWQAPAETTRESQSVRTREASPPRVGLITKTIENTALRHAGDWLSKTLTVP